MITLKSFSKGDAPDCDDIILVTEGRGETHKWFFQTVAGVTTSDSIDTVDGNEYDSSELSGIIAEHYNVAAEWFDKNAVKLFCPNPNPDLVESIVNDVKNVNDARGSEIADDESNEEINKILQKYGLEDGETLLEFELGIDGLHAVRDAEAGIY